MHSFELRPNSSLTTSRIAYAFQRPWTQFELRAFLTDGERRGLKDRLAKLLADDNLSPGRN